MLININIYTLYIPNADDSDILGFSTWLSTCEPAVNEVKLMFPVLIK